MKTDIHPEYHTEAKVACACGNTFAVGATVPKISTEVCSACHPFFTGEQRIVDTAGQVERFMRRLEAGETQRRADKDRRDDKRRSELAAKRKRRGLTPMITETGGSESPDGDEPTSDEEAAE